MQARAKTHLALQCGIGGETGAFAPAGTEPAVIHAPLSEDGMDVEERAIQEQGKALKVMLG